MNGDPVELNRVCVSTYAAITGEPLEAVQIATATQRVMQPGDAVLSDDPLTREAAAALHRQRLVQSSSSPVQPNPRQAGSPDDASRNSDALRSEELAEKRAHVSLLRQQMESYRSAVERRDLIAVSRAEQQRYHNRLRALVETDHDHPLEVPPPGHSPYAENIVALFGHDSHPRRRGSPSTADPDSWTPQGSALESNDEKDLGSDVLHDVRSQMMQNAERRFSSHLRRASGKRSPADASENFPRTEENAARPDSYATKHLQRTLSHTEELLHVQREKVKALRRRLEAAGIPVPGAANSPAGKKRHARGGDSTTTVHRVVSPSLYPAHYVVGQAAKDQWEEWKRKSAPSPNAVDSSKIRPLDPVVERRLHRPPVPFRPLEPVCHDITLRTHSIHNNKEPLRGDMLPRSQVPSPVFSAQTVKRVAHDDVETKKRRLNAIELSIAQSRLAEVNVARIQCGKSPLSRSQRQHSFEGDERSAALDKFGLPFFRDEDAIRLHDKAMSHMRATHQRLSRQAIDAIDKQQFHKPRKLTLEEQRAMALRLHDASCDATAQAMQKAVAAARADTEKVAPQYARCSTKSEIDATFARISRTV